MTQSPCLTLPLPHPAHASPCPCLTLPLPHPPCLTLHPAPAYPPSLTFSSLPQPFPPACPSPPNLSSPPRDDKGMQSSLYHEDKWLLSEELTKEDVRREGRVAVFKLWKVGTSLPSLFPVCLKSPPKYCLALGAESWSSVKSFHAFGCDHLCWKREVFI